MENKAVKTDKYGLLITIPAGVTYRIEWWQLDQRGLDYWLDHLGDKNWFTESIREEITEICNERSGSVFYR